VNPDPIPSKRFGQHFLRDKRIIQRIIDALDPQPDETIIEIGPGAGALTAQLIERAGLVVAVEFDNKLAPLLNEQFGNNPNFKLVMADALTTDFCAEITSAHKARLVANLPYNISTAILQRLIEQRACLTEMVLMLQREVVERMMAPAGSSERGYLSVLVEAYCDTEKLFDVGPGAFRPPPKVWSSVVRVIPKRGISLPREGLFWELVGTGFSKKRKTIFNNLRSATGDLADVLKKNGGASIVLCKAEVELQRRAETLTIDDWTRIVRAME
jgi:16S rRNA (adenine1518-N6/adenine1519-N6)-dimethyltransferase